MTLEGIVLVVLLLVNALGVLAVLFQLPGTWLILGATGAAAWLLRAHDVLGWWTIGLLAVLAVAGEVVETASGALGSRRWGGTRRGALLSIPAAIVGATLGASLAGSLALPVIWLVPAWFAIVLAGGAMGAAAGAMLGDRLVGRTAADARRAGVGAAVGRLGGTFGKVLVAAVMWGVVVFAIFL